MEVGSESIANELLDGELDNRPVVDRYYTKKFILGPRGDDYTYLIHSNKLCVIVLAPTHPIIKQNLNVTSVKFQVSDKLNRVDNAVSGKGKKGAQVLSSTCSVCMISCDSIAEPFIVPAGVQSKLLEVNEALLENPNLLKSNERGYIAILSPRTSDYEAQMKKLTSAEDYFKSRA